MKKSFMKEYEDLVYDNSRLSALVTHLNTKVGVLETQLIETKEAWSEQQTIISDLHKNRRELETCLTRSKSTEYKTYIDVRRSVHQVQHLRTVVSRYRLFVTAVIILLASHVLLMVVHSV